MSLTALNAEAVKPPMVSGLRTPQRFASTSTPSEHNLWSGLGGSAPKGNVWVTLKAIGDTVYFRFKAATESGSTSTTTSNGYPIIANTGEPFCVNATETQAIEVVSDSAAELCVTVTSDEWNRAGRVMP